MKEKRWLKISLICFLALSLSSCISAPKVQTCVMDPEAGVMWCAFSNQEAISIPIASTGNYVCYSPDDYQKILEYIKRLKKGYK